MLESCLDRIGFYTVLSYEAKDSYYHSRALSIAFLSSDPLFFLQVHTKGKPVDPEINWYEVARAMAGFTGADCMGLMQRAARMAARQV